MKVAIWIVVVLVIAGGYWYLWTHRGTNTTPVNTQATTTVATTTNDQSDNLSLGVDSNKTLGQFLIAYNGMTVYQSSKDSVGSSTCYGDCAKTWMPYTIPAGSPVYTEAGATGTAAAIVRADGTTQITYNGMPLYFYSGDQSVGDTNGEGVDKEWSVVKP